jgi:hypothetical protein
LCVPIFGAKWKIAAKAGGQRVRRLCPKCGRVSEFVEGTKTTTMTVLIAVDVVGMDSTVYCCSSCQDWMALDDTKPPPLTDKERAAQEKTREKEAKARDKKVDDELAALKKKLGK